MGRSRRAYDRKQNMLRWYTAALAVLAVSFFLMPIANGVKRSTRIPMYADGALFWIALLATVGMAVRINGARRRSQVFGSAYKGRKKLGLTHFFQNKPALCMDLLMFASLLAGIIAWFLSWDIIIQFLFISLFVFSFGMHCMLNGMNYIYIKHKNNS